MARSAGLYAGFWRRAAGYVIDSLVLLIPGFAIGALVANEALAALLQVLLWWLYSALMESSAGQATLGKKVFGIKVTDLHGERISFLRATARYFGKFISGILLGIGFLLAGFTSRKQALHDMMAGCLVVRAEAQADEIVAGGSTIPMTAGVWVIGVVMSIVPAIGILAAIAIPAYDDYAIRSKIRAAMMAAGPDMEVRASSPYVRSVVGDRNSGSIEIVLEPSGFRPGSIEAGATILYLLERGQWKCSARGVPPRYLPPSCR